MKQLNIIEAMQMPIGTEFEVIFDGERIPNNTMIISLDFIGTKEYKNIDWKCHPKESFMRPFDFLINGIFIPIQHSVSFMEVVNSDKRCRVKHKYVDAIRTATDLQTYYIKDFKNDKYIPLNYLMYILGYHNTPETIREIINDGEWYLEE